MEKRFHLLKELYDKILAGLPLTKDSHGYASLLNLLVPFQCLSAETAESYPEKCPFSFSDQCAGDSTGLVCRSLNINSEPDTAENGNHQRETNLLQLTLIDMLITKVRNPGLEDGTKQKYLDIIGILVKDASIDSKLIFALRSSDRLMSHVACKSLVSLVHFQLREEGFLNGSWLTFCSETLSGFPSSCWIAECLWTLTNIIREILKEESSGTTGGLDKLLSPLDGILEGFYHRVLSQVPDLDKSLPASAKRTNDLNALLDLLELLAASRSRTAVPFACQRMLFSHSAYLLGLVTCPVHRFIQRKSVVLLKRGVLCKAGEDLVKKASPPFLRDPHFNEDRDVFSSTVLQFVSSGWLNRLSVGEKVARFGGSQVRPELDICNGPDRVFLRALSLVLLKALEIRVQSCTSECEAQVLLESVMCPLLSFLKNCLRSSRCVHPFQHPCSWLSELFIEQDDDMFEASKALLSVHLHLRRFWLEDAFPSCLSDDQTQDTLTHRNGCNPHCVFLFLLQSVAFDPTVLLDFLISSETCFLEYLVRYLKLLVEDWPLFACVSKGFEPTASGVHSFSVKGPSNQEKNGRQLHAHAERTLCDPQYCTVPFLTSSQSYSVVLQFDNRVVKPNRSGRLRGSDNMPSLGSVPRLVDYESSEDSDGEEECLADRPQTLLNNQACSDTAILEHDASPPDDDLTVLPPSWHQGSPNEPAFAEGILWKSVKCLQGLHESISRLHRRNLFPYNPAALLKLLTRVDIMSGAGRSAPSPPSLECLVSLTP